MLRQRRSLVSPLSGMVWTQGPWQFIVEFMYIHVYSFYTNIGSTGIYGSALLFSEFKA